MDQAIPLVNMTTQQFREYVEQNPIRVAGVIANIGLSAILGPAWFIRLPLSAAGFQVGGVAAGQARSLLGGNRSGMEDMSLLEVSLRWLNLSGLFLFLEPLNYLAHFRYAGVKRTKAEVMMVQDVG